MDSCSLLSVSVILEKETLAECTKVDISEKNALIGGGVVCCSPQGGYRQFCFSEMDWQKIGPLSPVINYTSKQYPTIGVPFNSVGGRTEQRYCMHD